MSLVTAIVAFIALLPRHAVDVLQLLMPEGGIGMGPQVNAVEAWVSGPAGRSFGLAAGLILGGLALFLSVRALGPRKHEAVLKQIGPEAGVPLLTDAKTPPDAGTELRAAFTGCGTAFLAVLVFSALSNILMLTGAIYMLEVYDRVLPSRSVPTLMALSILAVMLFAMQGLLDAIRARLMVRFGAVLDASVNSRVLQVILRQPSRAHQQGDGLQPMRDLDAVRSFLGGPGPGALMDMPWLPFYLALIFIFHPVLGIAATAGTILLVGLTIITEFRTRGEVRGATQEGQRRRALAEAGRRNADAVLSMGMAGRLARRYASASEALIERQNRISDISGGIGSIARMLRLLLQSAMLGLGAWLVIRGEVSAGIIIAGSILVGRALAPVDQAIAQWKGFVAAREGWRRLSELLSRIPPEPPRLPLPAPRQQLTLEGVSVAEPGGHRILVRDVNIDVPAGSGLAIIGASGSGKSTLARAMVGAWPAVGGRIRLDGAALDQWPSELAGRHIGFLPQDVELFSGSIAENIARLDPRPEPEAVVAAAMSAGCHDMILNLAGGYQTQIGEGGSVLSAGQRQRVGLARSLYGKPFLVVLDEPNAHLDAEGDRALQSAIDEVRDRGGVAVVISHRPHVLDSVNLVLLMNSGQSVAFGPRDAILAKYFPTLLQQRPAHLSGENRHKKLATGEARGDERETVTSILERKR